MKKTGQISEVFAICILATLCFSQNRPATPASFSPGQPSNAKTKVVYVSDFDLDVENVTLDHGGPPRLPPPPGLPRLRKEKDPAKRAREFVDLMSDNLVVNLQKAGFTALRLVPGEARPKEGLLVEGLFAELDEGNRMRRAVIGFGSGASSMRIYASVSNLS